MIKWEDGTELFIDDRPRDLSIYEKYTDDEIDQLIEESNKRAKGEITDKKHFASDCKVPLPRTPK